MYILYTKIIQIYLKLMVRNLLLSIYWHPLQKTTSLSMKITDGLSTEYSYRNTRGISEEYPSKIYRQLGMHRHTSCARKMAQDSQLLAYELSMVYCRWPSMSSVGWRAWRAKSLTLSCQRFTHGTLLTDTWVIGK